MGAGHDTVARELARRAHERGQRAEVVDVLDLLPRPLGAALRHGYRSAVLHAPWTYAAVYRALLRRGGGPRPSGVPLARLAAGPLTERVEAGGADVVVPVFHLAAQLTGHLRARGLLRVPSTVCLVDFAVHRQWLHPGNDRYFCLTEEAARAVRADTGTPAEATGPVVAPGFLAAPDGRAAHWRDRFARHPHGDRPVVLSSGAWGAAFGMPATARALAHAGFLPVVLCGRNERLRARLHEVPGVLALGWVDDMPGLLHAARALVDNAAGQTAVQALAAGLPVVGHRPMPGHGAEGVARMAALGISDAAADTTALLASLERLTADGPERTGRIARGRALFRQDVLSRAAEAARAVGV
ncbi:galactosyldiacylglycerol synthase [Streptomyces sp. Ru71]|uniref:MGDG synthase family glycosyltransferase n=1 Tax=Streptomyces sp. Ru71 TaxID=2080746 RepID=UPI000CDD8CAA|nr:glycosyltransferase [Streptomyces sp. Ru71]POX51364.1 galactosyldiacylglycerol synthase [Streptomyces sp. Ru71]